MQDDQDPAAADTMQAVTVVDRAIKERRENVALAAWHVHNDLPRRKRLVVPAIALLLHDPSVGTHEAAIRRRQFENWPNARRCQASSAPRAMGLGKIMPRSRLDFSFMSSSLLIWQCGSYTPFSVKVSTRTRPLANAARSEASVDPKLHDTPVHAGARCRIRLRSSDEALGDGIVVVPNVQAGDSLIEWIRSSAKRSRISYRTSPRVAGVHIRRRLPQGRTALGALRNQALPWSLSKMASVLAALILAARSRAYLKRS